MKVYVVIETENVYEGITNVVEVFEEEGAASQYCEEHKPEIQVFGSLLYHYEEFNVQWL